MSNNRLISDYVHLAEASYADFTGIEVINGIYNSEKIFLAISNKKEEGGKDKPENFATLVTDNYDVVAHYTNRDDESGFSGTLFKNKQNPLTA